MKPNERQVLGRYRPYIWIPEQLIDFIGPGAPMTYVEASKLACKLAGDQPKPLLTRTMVDMLGLGAWLRSGRRVVHVDDDMVRALNGTDPHLTEEDVNEWTKANSPWLSTWFQFGEEASPIIFPPANPLPLTELLVFITADYGDERIGKLFIRPTLRVFAINSPREFVKTAHGLPAAPDTDIVWCHWPVENPITAEAIKKHNWVHPEEEMPGVIEDIKDTSILDNVLSLAANLVCYMHSDGAKIEHLEGPRKKDKRKTDYWRIGRGFKLRVSEAPVQREVSGGWTLSYRFWVSGHWRMQPYGPERSLRKRIWIEPYQKGPDVADKVHGGVE